MKEITASDCDRNAPEDGEGKKIISLQDIILNTNPHQFSFESYSSGRYVCPDSNPRTSPLSPVSSRVCVCVCVCLWHAHLVSLVLAPALVYIHVHVPVCNVPAIFVCAPLHKFRCYPKCAACTLLK